MIHSCNKFNDNLTKTQFHCRMRFIAPSMLTSVAIGLQLK